MSRSDLTMHGRVSGLDADGFEEAAERDNVDIGLSAELEGE